MEGFVHDGDNRVCAMTCGCNVEWNSAVSSNGIILLNYSGLEDLPCDKLCSEHKKLARTFYVKRNRLTRLPDDLSSHYPGITELCLASNRIIKLPECIRHLLNLNIVDVSDNEIRNLPKSLPQFKNLRKLHAPRNNLTSLPPGIGNLKNLRVLDVSYNNIHLVPSTIGQCGSLERIHLSNNHLRSIPREICALENLEQLSISSNKIVDLPIDMASMKELKSVDIDDNQSLFYVPYSPLSSFFHLDGCALVEPESRPDFHYVTVEQNVIPISCTLFMPNYVKTIGMTGDCKALDIPSLKELASLAVHSNSKLVCYRKSDLPMVIYNRLCSPLGHCYVCQMPLFWTAYVVVLAKKVLSSSLLHSTVPTLYLVSFTCSICQTKV